MIILLFIATFLYCITFVGKRPQKIITTHVTKDWTYIIKGILALLIIAHHVKTSYIPVVENQTSDYELRIWNELLPIGGIIVGIFFFVSGYGLFSSVTNKRTEYLTSFPRKRLLKITIPISIATIVQHVSYIFFTADYDIILRLKTFIVIGEGLLQWFSCMLLILYLTFYWSFKYNKDKSRATIVVFVITLVLSILLFLFNRGQWWWKSNMCFPLGMMYYIYEERIVQTIKEHSKLLITLLWIVLCSTLTIMYFNYWLGANISIYIWPIFLSTLSYFWIAPQCNRLLSFLSSISFELFLFQIPVMVIMSYYQLPTYIGVPLIYTCDIIIAYIAHLCIRHIYKVLHI